MKLRITLFIAAALSLTGCSSTLAPTYTSTNADLLRIGGDEPTNPEPEQQNLGSYCLLITDTWKEDGTTPDGQSIWSKDTARKAVPCRGQ